MPLTLIGYFPKRRLPAPDDLAASGAREICSVSECLAPGPPGWIGLWKHNDWGLFRTPFDARSAVPPASREYQLLAFSLLDRRFTAGEALVMPIERAGVSPLPSAAAPLGFDIASKSASDFFECSPLSCNYMALEIPVNRYCLVSDLAAAEQAALRFSREEPEPGDYFVLQVHRIESGGDTPDRSSERRPLQ